MNYWGRAPVATWRLIAVGLFGLATAALAAPPGAAPIAGSGPDHAAILMAQGTEAIAAARRAQGLGFPSEDVNRTGLIGLPGSAMTSSVGVLAAKRTTTNPNWATVVVRLLREAGVRRGDTVAAGFSGSFPALNLAVSAAARSLDIRLVSVAAVSASNWGANDPRFTWLDMERILTRAGLAEPSVAASVGGTRDAGVDLPPGGTSLVRQAIARSAVPLITAPSLEESVQRRMALYAEAAGGAPITAFVNVGGAQANLGACDESFLRASGLVTTLPPCAPGRQGVAHQFLARGVPVISLLNVRDLALRYGLPIDPIPLPSPMPVVANAQRTLRPAILLLAFAALSGLLLRST